jgi:hypothetical protein
MCILYELASDFSRSPFRELKACNNFDFLSAKTMDGSLL